MRKLKIHENDQNTVTVAVQKLKVYFICTLNISSYIKIWKLNLNIFTVGRFQEFMDQNFKLSYTIYFVFVNWTWFSQRFGPLPFFQKFFFVLSVYCRLQKTVERFETNSGKRSNVQKRKTISYSIQNSVYCNTFSIWFLLLITKERRLIIKRLNELLNLNIDLNEWMNEWMNEKSE